MIPPTLDLRRRLASHFDSDSCNSSVSGLHKDMEEPYLALKHAEGSDQPTFFSVSENKAIDAGDQRYIGELTNSNCWATPQGWILVRDTSSSTTFLMDPHTRTRIPLPHLSAETLSTYCTCLLSNKYPAADQSTTLVLLVETDAPVIWYCRLDGDTEWTRHEFDIGTLPLPDLGEGCSEKIVISPVTACRGKFYFNGSLKEVGVLEFCPAPVFSSITIRNAIAGPKGFRKVFMVESEQELYMVSLLSLHDLMVHKMDFCKQEWIEVKSIGNNRAFLLSPWYFGVSLEADKCGLERNCVYMVYAWKNALVILNVGDGTSKVHNLEHASSASDQALWMVPTHP